MVAALVDECDDLHIERLRLQVELARWKMWYIGSRADRLQSEVDVTQMLLSFAAELGRRPVNPHDIPPHSDPEEQSPRRDHTSSSKGNAGTGKGTLGAVQSLYLALLIDAKHLRVLGWIEIEADDIFESGGELRSFADLETLNAMRLQSMLSPEATRPVAALVLGDHCVALSGMLSVVLEKISETFSAMIVGVRPDRGASFTIPPLRQKPAAPPRSHARRYRHALGISLS